MDKKQYEYLIKIISIGIFKVSATIFIATSFLLLSNRDFLSSFICIFLAIMDFIFMLQKR